jgi:hypothetical protein
METIPNNQPSTITVHRRRSVCESDLSPTISLIRRIPDYHLADQAIMSVFKTYGPRRADFFKTFPPLS